MPSFHLLAINATSLNPSAGVQGLVGPDALLCGARQERPAAHGHPGLREPLQGQEAVHGSVSRLFGGF